MKAEEVDLTIDSLMPLPEKILKEGDLLTDVEIYLMYHGRPVLYKRKGVPVTKNFLLESAELLKNLYIKRDDTRIIVEGIHHKLLELYKKEPDLEVLREVFGEMGNLMDTVLALPNKENLDVVKRFTGELAGYMENNPDSAYLVAFTLKKDFTTSLHISNVGALVSGFALHLGYKGEDYKKLVISAFMHDVGKVKVPDEILKKPGKLTDEEYRIMKMHPTWGADILKSTGNIEHVPVALFHHECMDGSGYPSGLTGDRIPDEAKIVQICDIYEALTGIRPYRKPMDPYEALNLVRDQFLKKKKIDKDLYADFVIFLYRNRTED